MTEAEVQKRLEEKYPDSMVRVADLTGGGSNFQVLVESAQFAGMTRIKQHQEVMAIFDAELKSGEVHALQIKTLVKES